MPKCVGSRVELEYWAVIWGTVIMFSYDSETVTSPIRWALIDGLNSSGRLHVDFPRNARFFMDGEWTELKSGYCLPEELLLPLYKTLVVTSFFYGK